MRIKMKLVVIVLSLMTSCTADTVVTVPLTSPSAMPISSSLTGDTKEIDDSVRAIGKHPAGRLIVKPASNASVSPLGAPSCYGLETDLRWSGDYEAVWESLSDGTSSIVMTFLIDFEIIQPNDEPVEMQKISFGETEIFAYVPRYTDCHALETYLFGVSDGKAFPITFEMNPEQIWTNIGKLPQLPCQVTKDELILTGGYGAGQDFINVYHFRYDSNKRSMIVKNTDKVKPNDIVYNQ